MLRSEVRRIQLARGERVTLHPLGKGATLGQDHHTSDNRKAVADCLYLYYSGELGKRINRREEAASGRELAHKFVSHLEIANALKRLESERPDLGILLDLRFGFDWPIGRIAAQVHRAKATVTAEIDEALNLLIDVIWQDSESERKGII